MVTYRLFRGKKLVAVVEIRQVTLPGHGGLKLKRFRGRCLQLPGINVGGDTEKEVLGKLLYRVGKEWGGRE